MLEIFVAIVMVLLAAKRTGSGRRRFNLRRIRVTDEQALGTLATDTALSGALHGANTVAFRVVSAKLTWALTNLTAGEGPITVGYAHSDYTVTEIKECMEAQASADIGNKVAQEQANRLIRIVGVFSGANTVLNDGRPIKTKLNWVIGSSATLNAFIYNEDTAANLTTGAFLNTQGDLWVKDSI